MFAVITAQSAALHTSVERFSAGASCEEDAQHVARTVLKAELGQLEDRLQGTAAELGALTRASMTTGQVGGLSWVDLVG